MSNLSNRSVNFYIALAALVIVGVGAITYCRYREGRASRGEVAEFRARLDTFLREASKLEAMTGSETRQPAFEEQLKSVESAFVAADKFWPKGNSYQTARSLFADALKEWRLCEELRVSGLLDQIRATSNGQVAELAQDKKLRTKAAGELEKSFEASRDRGVHETRASHAFHQGMGYLDHTSR